MNKTIDLEAVRELVLYATNDSKTYFGSAVPVISALSRKVKKGVYDPEKAVKAFGYTADYAARRYTQEFAQNQRYFDLFPAFVRRAAAAELLDYYSEEINAG